VHTSLHICLSACVVEGVVGVSGKNISVWGVSICVGVWIDVSVWSGVSAGLDGYISCVRSVHICTNPCKNIYECL
jgi:hypothetical protein